ncbi:MFS transporter [Streptomyces sp. NPDC087440]|uniref:MFS transporter n=1 Tax=Streptomyces sp. NPDC087440 TaxID=3365790 RepID=UPI00382C0D88
MSAQSSPTAPAPRPPASAPSAPDLSAAQSTTLLWSMFAGFTTLYIAYSGLLGVLLPIQVEQIAPDTKEASLATVTMVSSIVTLFVQPIVGAMSDRTRSRFGRRSPWMALGAVASVIALVALRQASSLLWLTVLWVAAQVLLNMVQAPLTAIMADRVAPERFGVCSAAVGIGSQVGATFGVLIATSFATRFSTGYAVIAALVLVVTLAFLLVNKDRQSTAPVEPFSWSGFLKGFWISPRRHPDFAWAFLARVVFILGYWGIFSYQRYALTDYVGLKGDDVNHVQTVMALLTMAGALVASIPAGRISDRTGRRKVFVMASSVVLAAGCAVPLISPTAGGMYAYAVLAGIGFGTYMSLDMALMTEVLPSGSDAGKDLGILNIATNVPQALGPMVGAWIIGAFSEGANKVPGYHVLFVYAIVVVLLGAVAVRPIKSVK